jgi:mRNA-decapping enzyme subunit 2
VQGGKGSGKKVPPPGPAVAKKTAARSGPAPPAPPATAAAAPPAASRLDLHAANVPSADLLEELAARFVLNCPEEELNSFERILFLVEQAHW